ncbi:glutathione S-transferase N-terminal domain-containing protein [Pseudomonas sp. UBA2684]|uniref:glutathione S-transferase N-terminal domain-containing protein n=1 Tax=Pseudomonas sp. UBA2684 TaxID=1947311 RepID=UPI0025D71D97|nr:glutathione S-transferase N-terminal domain-containing protein [Pseudomonas sp. UBA2684]
MRELYELRGADPELLFSPYCWRVRLALHHKDLAFVSRPLRFSDKQPLLACSGQQLVPVLCDGEAVVHDSLAIFQYLDLSYPERPLLGSGVALERARLVERLVFQAVRMPLLKILLPRVFALIDPADREYFRSSREKALGTTLEAFADPAAGTEQFRVAIAPLQTWLSEQPYLDGAEPGGSDYLVAGLFLWAWCLGEQPWAAGTAVDGWFQRILATYQAQHGPVKRA